MQRTLLTRFLSGRAKLVGSNMGFPERLVTPIIHFWGVEVEYQKYTTNCLKERILEVPTCTYNSYTASGSDTALLFP